MAVGLQGFSVAHGLMQLLCRHARVEGHSSSPEHPTSTGAALMHKIEFRICETGLVTHFWLTYFCTQLISFPSKSFNASAGHCSERKAVVNFAHSICDTRPEGSAWVETYSSSSLRNTGLLTRAILIFFTAFVYNWFWNLKNKKKLDKVNLLRWLIQSILGVHATPYGSPVKPGWQVQMPLWFLGEQSANLAHLQGSTHFSSLHANVVGHSGSVRHSYGLHLICGSGSGLYPCGHEHKARWFWAEQIAFTPHLSRGHGSTQSLLMHVWVNGHSWSLLHPAIKIQNKMALPWSYYLQNNLRSSQMVYGSPMYPTRQMQTALWLLTLHSAFVPHTVVKQGFWHLSWIHARWAGQSGSIVHSGFGAEIRTNMACNKTNMQISNCV